MWASKLLKEPFHPATHDPLHDILVLGAKLERRPGALCLRLVQEMATPQLCQHWPKQFQLLFSFARDAQTWAKLLKEPFQQPARRLGGA